jgi:hypothetical protein
MKRSMSTIALGALCLFAAASVHAGPPLLCHPIEIGDARSLPWNAEGWSGRRADYDRARLVGDTLALLGADVPVIERLETLRRAGLYAGTDAKAAEALLARLETRADAHAKDALAQLDAGYLSAVYRQVERVERPPRSMPHARGDAYARLHAATALRPGDPQMEYAAALVAHGTPAAEPHLVRALEGAKDDARLARTLAAHEPLWGTRLADLRARQGRAAR